MNFAAPGLLAAGLAAVALPILIHMLFRRRRRPIEWAAMEILREALRRTERRRRIERWLLLALRCLLVACVAAAVAEPLWRSADASVAGAAGGVDAVIVLDDGVAQQCASDGSDGLARSKDAAMQALDALGPGDRAALVLAGSTDSGPRRAVWPPTADLDRVRDAVRSVQVTFLPSQIQEAIRIAATPEMDGRNEGVARRRMIVLCSEHREGSWEGQSGTAAAGDPMPGVVVIATAPAQDDPVNVTVDSVAERPRSPLAPEGAHVLRVSLARSANAAGSGASVQDVTLDGGVAAARAAVPWAEGQRESAADATITLPSRSDAVRVPGYAVTVSLASPDAQPADNIRHAIVDARSSIEVVLVDQAGGGSSSDGEMEGESGARWVDRALRPVQDADVRVEMADPSSVSPRTLRDADAVILLRPDLLDDAGARAVADFARAGGVVVMCPPGARLASAWADRVLVACGTSWTVSREPRDEGAGLTLASEQPASTLLAQLAPELRDLASPVVVSRRHTVEMPAASGETLLALRDGTALAVSAPVGRGMLVLLAVAPEVAWSTMPVKPIMVPFLQEIIRQGKAIASSARTVRTGATRIEPPSAAFGGGELRMLDGSAAVSVSPDGSLSEPLLRSGCAEVTDSAGRRVALHAIDIDTAWASCVPSDPSAVEQRIAAAVRAEVEMAPPRQVRQSVDRWRAGGSSSGNASEGDMVALGGRSLAWIAFAVAVVLALAEMVMARATSHAAVSTRSAAVATRAAGGAA